MSFEVLGFISHTMDSNPNFLLRNFIYIDKGFYSLFHADLKVGLAGTSNLATYFDVVHLIKPYVWIAFLYSSDI